MLQTQKNQRKGEMMLHWCWILVLTCSSALWFSGCWSMVSYITHNTISVHFTNELLSRECAENVFYLYCRIILTYLAHSTYSVYCSTFSFSYGSYSVLLCYLNQIVTVCIVAWKDTFEGAFQCCVFATVPADYKSEISSEEKVNICYSQVCHSWEHDYQEWKIIWHY